MEDLRIKLEEEGYSNISYVIVNHQGNDSQLKYTNLKSQVSKHIPVYQQEESQTDVWTLLNGNKDDFLIYDRCGRLVYHLGLPFSLLLFPYVEEAIKTAYCEKKCGNCSLMTLANEDFCKNKSLAAMAKITKAPQPSSLSHHHNHPLHHLHAHFGHQHLGNHQPSENQQPDVPASPEHVHAPGHRHHHKHKGQQTEGNPEN